jgi:hypothetical protein
MAFLKQKQEQYDSGYEVLGWVECMSLDDKLFPKSHYVKRGVEIGEAYPVVYTIKLKRISIGEKDDKLQYAILLPKVEGETKIESKQVWVLPASMFSELKKQEKK